MRHPIEYTHFGNTFLFPTGDGLHIGADLNWGPQGDSDFGKPVYPISSGVVYYTQESNVGYGNMVVIWHSNIQKFSKYAHLKEIFVSKEQKVNSLQPIGTLGSTGNSTSPHVHCEILDETAMNLFGPTGYPSKHPVEWLKEHYFDPVTFVKPRVLKVCIVAIKSHWILNHLANIQKWFFEKSAGQIELVFHVEPIEAVPEWGWGFFSKPFYSVKSDWFDFNISPYANEHDIVALQMPPDLWKGDYAAYAEKKQSLGLWRIALNSKEKEVYYYNYQPLQAFEWLMKHEILHCLYQMCSKKDNLHEYEYEQANIDKVFIELDFDALVGWNKPGYTKLFDYSGRPTKKAAKGLSFAPKGPQLYRTKNHYLHFIYDKGAWQLIDLHLFNQLKYTLKVIILSYQEANFIMQEMKFVYPPFESDKIVMKEVQKDSPRVGILKEVGYQQAIPTIHLKI